MLNKTFLKKMKKDLLSQRKNLIFKAQEGQHIEIDTDGDEYDEVQGNLIIEMHNQLHTRNNHKLSRIDNALQQIEDNKYGICVDCGDPIPEKRLLSNPYTMTCIGCAEDREAEEKQTKRDSY